MRIRTAAVEDAAIVLKWKNNHRIWELDDPDPYSQTSAAEFAGYWKSLLTRHAVWMLEEQDRAVGQMGWVHRGGDTAEFFIMIGEPDQWDRGLGRFALSSLLDRAREAGLKGLYGRVLGHNLRAQHLFFSLGFKLMAMDTDCYRRYGQIHDVLWLAHDLKAANPRRAPRSVPDFLDADVACL